jgi:DNA-binding MarR family transcriptional regulator
VVAVVPTSDRGRRRAVPAAEVDVVVRASRVFGSLIATTLAQVQPPVSMPQWRVLVLAAEGGCHVSTIAEDLAVHPSNATRIVDRLVSAGLVERHREDADRRQVLVTLTERGGALYDTAMDLRRDRLEAAMVRLSAPERRDLVAVLERFTEAVLQGPGPTTGPDPG